jgi:hypothetical protein
MEAPRQSGVTKQLIAKLLSIGITGGGWLRWPFVHGAN